MPKNKAVDSEKAKQEYRYWRISITYSDDEISGHRVFKDREKAEQYAARQGKSPVVKKIKIEAFTRDRHEWHRAQRNPTEVVVGGAERQPSRCAPRQ
jgi:hypothetical protein